MTAPRRWTAAAAAVVLACGLAARPARAGEEIVSVPTLRPGVIERVLVVDPPRPAGLAVILFVGAAGRADVDKHAGGRGGNTLYRGLDIFVRAGITAAVVDVPSDRSSLWNVRTGADHAADIAQVIALLKRRGAGKVWLAGISMGSVSVANAARRLKTGGPDGIVMLSSVVNSNREFWETVLTVPLDQITVPVLVVRNPADDCKSSPPSGADRILDGLDHAPVKRLMEFSGGSSDRSGPCQPFSAHGFVGQEERVLSAVADWIKAPH